MPKFENALVSFRWNNQLEDQIASFVELRKSEALVDCTIVSGSIGGDCQKFKAHRIILCANSQYIHDLIFSKGVGNDVNEIHLPSIPSKDMKYILDFMYKGVVQVEVADVNSFLHSAHFLQVSGIIEKGSFKKRVSPSKPLTKGNEGKSKQTEVKRARISINPVRLTKSAKSDFESEEEVFFSNENSSTSVHTNTPPPSTIIVLSDSDNEQQLKTGSFEKVNISINSSADENGKDKRNITLDQENQLHKTPALVFREGQL
ncbi:protein abrupt-like isoform X2 [Cimex lectularius]|uniref:BTB domain-containing protein n=1 Tax=Cimex lectularius TaxID=79782 RepID=A0A8I6SAF5_CIMLE|nr:protein abrupt-like isoform X2 [Cimex lectularius]